jgi:hypothetical protein
VDLALREHRAAPPRADRFTVAVMQPYFIPYAGYFRLLAAADLLVVFDCVQFPRRGWVHRNRLTAASGEPEWLTLPIARCARETLITDLRFAEDAAGEWQRRLREFPLLERAGPGLAPLMEAVRDVAGTPADYILRLMERVAGLLGLPWRIVRSSALGIDPRLRAQDRVIEIVRRMGGSRYVNPPGGRALYDAEAFARAGIELRFLTDFPGPSASILERLIGGRADALTAEIRAAAEPVP